MQLQLHRFIGRTGTEGPGIRACVQVQGCPIRCVGCAVPQTWSGRGGFAVSAADLTAQILSVSDIGGVTFLGGEPFAQARAVAQVAAAVRRSGLSVMTFTGYTIEDLRGRGSSDIEFLLGQTDLLVDGPFIAEKVDLSRPWVGSTNQRFHFLTNRYAHLAPELAILPNRLAVRIFPDGRVVANGLAPVEQMKALMSGLS